MQWWEKLPEWARWILCWPVLTVIAAVLSFIGLYIGGLATDRLWISETLGQMAVPIISSLVTLPVLFASIQYFVPKKQHYVIFVWCLFALLGLLASAFMTYVGYINDSDDFWWTVRDLVWSMIGLAMGVYYFSKVKDEVARQKRDMNWLA